jgi:hypothetical protein
MHFHDPSRALLGNGRPQWLGARQALPGLYVEPLPGGQWQVTVMVEGRWVEVAVPGREALALVLQAWEEGPEEALRAIWGREPPSGGGSRQGEDGGPGARASARSAEDLGL